MIIIIAIAALHGFAALILFFVLTIAFIAIEGYTTAVIISGGIFLITLLIVIIVLKLLNIFRKYVLNGIKGGFNE